MNFSVDINWLKSTKEQRATLYRVIRNISDLTGKSVEDLMEDAFGYKLLTGADYLSNFRQGKIDRKKAKLIHAWVVEHHNETAHTIAPELFSEASTNDWDSFIEQHAIHGKLRVVRLPLGRGIIQRAGSIPKADQTLRLGEKFCFELDSDIAGTAIAFQGYQGQWYPLPLGADHADLSTEIQSGVQLLPLSSQNKPVELVEHEDIGIHQFVFVINPMETTDKFPLSINDNTRVYMVKVNFAVKE